MRALGIAFVAGLIFAVGLGISGMTDPSKVIGFLDVAGHWDPSLAFVMAGAIGVHVGPALWFMRVRRPAGLSSFAPTGDAGVDAPLVVGSALFGLGWGTAGFCPGPAVVDLVAPSTAVVTFVGAMVAGMVGFRAMQSRLRIAVETCASPFGEGSRST
jgi:uncharacterized protein